MIRRVVALVLVAALVYAGWHVGIAWFHYRNFQDSVRDTALFGQGKTDDALKAKVMELASQNGVPLDAETITIERPAGEVRIQAQYTDSVKILPGYTRPVTFTVK